MPERDTKPARQGLAGGDGLVIVGALVIAVSVGTFDWRLGTILLGVLMCLIGWRL